MPAYLQSNTAAPKTVPFSGPQNGTAKLHIFGIFSAAFGGLHGDRGYTQICLAHPCTDNPRHKTTTRPHIEWKVGPVLRPNNGPISGAIFWTLFWYRTRGTNCALHFVVAVFWARKRPLFWGRGRAPKHDQKAEKSHSLKQYLFQGQRVRRAHDARVDSGSVEPAFPEYFTKFAQAGQ